jgi:hypothetical protein
MDYYRSVDGRETPIDLCPFNFFLGTRQGKYDVPTVTGKIIFKFLSVSKLQSLQ